MARPPIVDAEVKRQADEIMGRYGMTYTSDFMFCMEKQGSQFSWDRFHSHRFFSNPNRLNGCCGVIEMQTCYAPSRNRFPGVTLDEWKILFHFHVRDLLRVHHRRMALITLINSQKALVPLVQYAGFNLVSTGFNPGTRRKVNLWALSI